MNGSAPASGPAPLLKPGRSRERRRRRRGSAVQGLIDYLRSYLAPEGSAWRWQRSRQSAGSRLVFVLLLLPLSVLFVCAAWAAADLLEERRQLERALARGKAPQASQPAAPAAPATR